MEFYIDLAVYPLIYSSWTLFFVYYHLNFYLYVCIFRAGCSLCHQGANRICARVRNGYIIFRHLEVIMFFFPVKLKANNILSLVKTHVRIHADMELLAQACANCWQHMVRRAFNDDAFSQLKLELSWHQSR